MSRSLRWQSNIFVSTSWIRANAPKVRMVSRSLLRGNSPGLIIPDAGRSKGQRNQRAECDVINDLTLRDERPEDFPRVEEIHAAAFGGVREVEVVRAIRSSSGYRAKRSFVASTDSIGIVGHLLTSPVGLHGPDDIVRAVTVIAPLAVDPQAQRRGIGSRLLLHTIARYDDWKYPLLVLRGELEYYGRFGFVPSVEIDIHPPFVIATDRYLARRLSTYDPTFRGTVRYPSTFASVGYPSQWSYELAAKDADSAAF
jgi:putative acetyltransferase